MTGCVPPSKSQHKQTHSDLWPFRCRQLCAGTIARLQVWKVRKPSSSTFFLDGGGHVCACVLWYSHVLTVFVEALEGAKGLLLTLSLSLFLSVCLSSGPWLRASNSRDHGRVSSLPHWGGKTLPGGRGPCLNKQSGDETGTEAGWLCPSGWAATALWLKKGLLEGYCNHIRTHSIIS